MFLLDKGYFDYDYEKVEKIIKWEDTVLSDDEVSDMLSMFGMGPKAKAKPTTTEDIQSYIIKHMEDK